MFLTVTVWLFAGWTILYSAPYPHPEEVYAVGFTAENSTEFSLYQIAPQLQAYREQLDVFSEYAAVCFQTANVVLDQEPVESSVARTVEGTFKMLGVVPAMGRAFLPEEYRPGGDDVVVLSYKFWKEKFRADPRVLGRTIQIDDRVCRVVGVLPENKGIPIFYSAVYRPWVPVLDPANPFEWPMMSMVRLKAGVSVEQATLALRRTKLDLSAQYLKWLNVERTTLIKPNLYYHPEIFRFLFGAALFLFAIACLNTVNLMLVRVLGRSREFSIRRAIGCLPAQVVRLIAMEATLISFTAGFVVYVVHWAVREPRAYALDRLSERYAALDLLDGDSVSSHSWSSQLCLLGATSAWRIRHAKISAGLKDSGRPRVRVGGPDRGVRSS